jgi:hypothetical protein
VGQLFVLTSGFTRRLTALCRDPLYAARASAKARMFAAFVERELRQDHSLVE